MDIVQLYQDFSVDFLTEGHKHCRPGWVNTPCPYCVGNAGYHLGFDIQNTHYYCWRCGWHPTAETIAILLNVSNKEAYSLIKSYGLLLPRIQKQPVIKIRKKAHRMPTGTMPLQKNHKRYLEGRLFDSVQLEQEWNLVGTGPVSSLDGVDYKHRIIAPILWDHTAVSFQGRDITNKSYLRYRACPKDRELIHHKEVLYGKQEKWKDIGICVEGITDVWRLGTSACATFGIEYTYKQVRILAKTFRRLFIIFDDDPQAVKQANKLSADLRFRGVETEVIILQGDPGGMSQDDANHLVHELLKKSYIIRKV